MGLTFVVIALMADARRSEPTGMRGYITPTIIHFGVVLVLSAFLSMPRQSNWSVSLGSGALGVGGVIYTGAIVGYIRQFATQYAPVGEDWRWHVIWPMLVYAALCVFALVLWREPIQCMYGIAASLTLLLFIGVHNAWDVAVSVAVQKQKDTKKHEQST